MHTIYIQAKQKNKTKQKKSHNYLKSLTQEVTMHIRNAQGGPLMSVFDLVCGFNRNFSFTLNFSFRKNVMKTLSLRVASSKEDIVSCN